MSSSPSFPHLMTALFFLPLLLLGLTGFSTATSSSRKLMALVQPPPNLLTYHHGAVLQGDIPVSILWYGRFSPAQKAILSDFFLSLDQSHRVSNPSVSQWWDAIHSLYLSKAGPARRARVVLAGQVADDACSMGKTLKRAQIVDLAGKAAPARKGGIAVVFTAEDVTVEGFCMSGCGSHGSISKTATTYIWVGNSATQCPGQCSWPFHQPIYGPQGSPLVAPNGDVGVDGMVISLASMLAGTMTNPFGDGFFQGPKEAPLEAATACPGVYGKGAYPGYAGDLLLDPATGSSYNANGALGRKYLLPALFDPSTSTCSTLA